MILGDDDGERPMAVTTKESIAADLTLDKSGILSDNWAKRCAQKMHEIATIRRRLGPIPGHTCSRNTTREFRRTRVRRARAAPARLRTSFTASI
jgi:hypothetical protein